jgi:hypothetical protein
VSDSTRRRAGSLLHEPLERLDRLQQVLSPEVDRAAPTERRVGARLVVDDLGEHHLVVGALFGEPPIDHIGEDHPGLLERGGQLVEDGDPVAGQRVDTDHDELDLLPQEDGQALELFVEQFFGHWSPR